MLQLTIAHYFAKAKEGALSEWLRDFVQCRVKVIVIGGAVRPPHASPQARARTLMRARAGCLRAHSTERDTRTRLSHWHALGVG